MAKAEQRSPFAPAGSNRSRHGGDEMSEAFGWHRQLVGCGQQVDWARGMAIYIIAAMLLISVQTRNVCVLDALCSAAVR